MFASNYSEVGLPFDEVEALPVALTPDTDPDSPGRGLRAPRPAPEDAGGPPAAGEERFKFEATRATRTTRWGVDVNFDSERSLTVSAIPPGNPGQHSAITVCNASAAKPLKAGDVIVAINSSTTQAAMMDDLKQETSLTMDIVRRSTFDAVIERKSTLDDKGQTKQESLGLKVVRSNGKLLIDKIDIKGPVKRYNAQNYLQPLVRGDVIVSVDSNTECDEMVRRIKECAQFTLSVERPAPTSSRRASAISFTAGLDDLGDSRWDTARAA
jgi:hypothetical protein